MTSPSPRISAPAAAQRLRLVQQRWPTAAQLARLLSLAVRIEPALLRAARLAAGLDAASEADLWFSGIIASTGTLGISFVPAVAEALRRELAASPGERALAWQLVEEHHGQQPWSIRLEERINYLTTGPSAKASEIEDLLAAALSELHEVRARDEQAALGIARWLLAALARAPAAARATPTAAAAELAAGVHLDGRLGGADQLARAENSELLPWLLDHLGTTVLPVRLLPGTVALGGEPPDGIPLPVPVTDPLVVSVIWGSGSDAHHEHVRVTPGEELLVPVEATEVELHTLAGGGVVLRRAGIGRILVNGVDRGAGFAVASHAILTATPILGARALHSGAPDDPSGSFASEAPASKTEDSEDADAGPSGSGSVSGVVYVPESGEPINARAVATDTELDVVLLEPEQAVPEILPVGQIQPGQQWRLQALPERGPTESRQSANVPAASFRGVVTAGDPRPQFMLMESTGSLHGQAGAAITLENPWGAVIGLLLAETAELPLDTVEQGRIEEGATPSRPLGSLRVAPIDAILARFNLARQITPATAALVDGKWPEKVVEVRPLTGEQLRLMHDAVAQNYDRIALQRVLALLDRHLDLISGPGSMNIVVFEVLETARREGWLTDLLTMFQNSDYPAVREVANRILTADISSSQDRSETSTPDLPAADPYMNCMIGGQPFIDRNVLRLHFKDLLSDSPSRVLVIIGDRPCGKSYTWRYVAQPELLGGIIPVLVDLAEWPEPPRPTDIMSSIALQLGLPEPAIDEHAQGAAQARRLRDWLVGRLQRREGKDRWLMVFDSLDHVAQREETLQLIEFLAGAAIRQRLPGLRVILLGYTSRLPLEWLDSVLTEEIQDIGAQDLRDFYRRLAQREKLSISDQAIDLAVQTVLSLLPDDRETRLRLLGTTVLGSAMPRSE